MIYDSIIYHNPCSDGIASAWVVKHFHTSAELIPCYAGQNPQVDIEIFRNKNIIYVDLCPNNDYLTQLLSIVKHITILDHHITAYNSIDKELLKASNINYIFDNNMSGCMITWKYFSQEKIPWFLDYIGDRDLWLWKLPFSREITTTLYDDEHVTMKNLSKLFDTPYTQEVFQRFVQRGTILCEIKEKQKKTCMKTALHCKYQDYNIWLYTSTVDIISDVGNALMDKTMKDGIKPDFTVNWRYNVLTHEYILSMRSLSHAVDVSDICKNLGGGGHRNAAGCTLPGSIILRDFFIPQIN
jgi:oligoribonuclease NrnB/cAMP/cGMP phosphodiesterase (DHH superfamily)